MPRQYGQGLVKISLYVTPEILAELAKMPKGEASQYVRDAIYEKLRNDVRRAIIRSGEYVRDNDNRRHIINEDMISRDANAAP
jgi:hypothetical protein